MEFGEAVHQVIKFAFWGEDSGTEVEGAIPLLETRSRYRRDTCNSRTQREKRRGHACDVSSDQAQDIRYGIQKLPWLPN